MMLDKKQIWAIFLFEFKMSCKAAETTHINNAFGPGTANEHTVQWQFKKFCKRDKSLEDEKCSVQPSELDNDHLRGSTKLVLLQLHKKLPKNSMSTILQSFNIWSKLERWKDLINGCPISWQQIKKTAVLKSSSLILQNNNEPFLYRIVTYDKKWILYNNQWQPAQWLYLKAP